METSLVFLLQSQPSPKQSEYMANSATSTSNHTNDVNNIIRHVCILILLRNILNKTIFLFCFLSMPHVSFKTQLKI